MDLRALLRAQRASIVEALARHPVAARDWSDQLTALSHAFEPERGETPSKTASTLAASIGDGATALVEAVLTVAEAHGVPISPTEGAILFELGKRSEDATRAPNADAMFDAVAGQLRAPLQSLCSWTMLLRDESLDSARMQRGLETVERSASDALAVVEDAVVLQRLLRGDVTMKPQRVSILEVARDEVRSARRAAERRNVELDVALPSDVGVWADADMLRDVLRHLLGNALKFTPAGGTVRLTAQRVGSVVEISVTDTGAGFEPGAIPRLFKRFDARGPDAERAPDAERGRFRGPIGAGLGLPIIQRAMTLLGGTVRASSEGPGRGATFVVSVAARAPATKQRPAAPAPSPTGLPRPAGGPLEGVSVLVVDDESDARDLAAMVLSQAGAAVYAAESAGEALDRVRKHPPDVLVSDIGMPGEDGHSLIKTIRHLPRPICTVRAMALTALTRPEDRHRSLNAGFDMHVGKPIEPSSLIAAVTKLAGRDPTLFLEDAPP